MTEPVTFTVYGTAKPAGSKRVLPAGGRAGGRPIIVDDSKGSRGWKQDVAEIARHTMGARPPLEGPLALELVFYVSRPKVHYGAAGLKPSAPPWPTKRPDVLKLARAVEDALSTICYLDDAQIAHELIVKRYGLPERVDVTVRDLAANDAAEPTAAAS